MGLKTNFHIKQLICTQLLMFSNNTFTYQINRLLPEAGIEPMFFIDQSRPPKDNNLQLNSCLNVT